MNERIKELVEQAVEEVKHTDPWVYKYYFHAPNEFLEKFAELLVKECAKFAVKAANDAEIKMMDNFIIEFWIKKHFGVEE